MQKRWIVSLVASAVMASGAYAHDLHVSVVPARAVATAAQEAEVTLQYSNTGRETLYVYKWNLPSQELRDPLFEVSRDGKAVSYVGPLVKRRSPTADDVIAIAPGKSVSTSVKLAQVYDMTQSGNYTIHYKMDADRVVVRTARKAGLETAQSVASNSEDLLESADATMFVEGRKNIQLEKAKSVNWFNGMLDNVMASSISYTSCSSSRQSSINSAVTAGANYAAGAVNYLAGTTPSGTPRYTTWFGKYSSSNWSAVKTHYTNIQSTLQTKPLQFDCTCTDSGTFAYVYPTQPYKYYLCGAFWSAPTTGTDSKGGTLVHESSHFNVNAGTQDYAYGQTDAKALAKSTPSKAIMNADNHEYFAENNPAQQ
jgi:peptidyl-Lys metalloendopeptidase